MRQHVLTILDNHFNRIGEIMPDEYFDDVISQDLTSGLSTFEATIDKEKCQDVQLVTNDSHLVLADQHGEREMYSLFSVNSEDEHIKSVTWEHWALGFLQDDADAIKEPEQDQDLRHYLEFSLEGTPIEIGNIATLTKRTLNLNTEKRATRLQTLYKEFDVEPVFTTVFANDRDDQPSYIQLDLLPQRGQETTTRLDSETNLIKATYYSNKDGLITCMKVLPFETTEQKVTTIKVEKEAVQATPKKETTTTTTTSSGLGSKTEKQLAYLKRQKGGRYTQDSRRNNWSPEPTWADCSSMVYKSLIYAGIPCGYSKGQWLGTTYTLRNHARAGRYFDIVKGWSKIEPGDIILCNNWGHVITYVGNNQIFHASSYSKPHHYASANYWKNKYNMIIRPKDRGSRKVSKPATTQTTVLGNSNKDQVWMRLKKEGMTDIGASGIMGNLYQESRYNPRAVQAGGPGRGLAQWSVGDRWQSAIKFASNNGLDVWSIEAQVKFIRYELSQTWESTNMMNRISQYGGQKKANGWESFKTITNVDKAMRCFLRVYERAGVPHESVRLNEARAVYKKYKGTQSGNQTPVKNAVTYESKEVTETVEKTYSIKEIAFDDGNFYTLNNSEEIINREAQQLYGFNEQNKSNYLTGIYEMRTSAVYSEFESAMRELAERSQPQEEYQVDLGQTDDYTREMLLHSELGDELQIVSHNWDRDQDLILTARVSEIDIMPRKKENIAVTLTGYVRHHIEVPEDVLDMQERIKQVEKEELNNLSVSLNAELTTFTDKDQTSTIEAVVMNSGRDLTSTFLDIDFHWQMYDRAGLPVDNAEPRNILDTSVPISETETTKTYRTEDVTAGLAYYLSSEEKDVKYRFTSFHESGYVIDESDEFEWTDKIMYQAPLGCQRLEVTAIGSTGVAPVKVMTQAIPYTANGKRLVIESGELTDDVTVVCRVMNAQGSITIHSVDYSKVGIYKQSTPPDTAELYPGDEWKNGDDIMVWNGQDWEDKVVQRDITDIKDDLFLVKQSADGKTNTYRGTATPTNAKVGDMWYRSHPEIVGEKQMLTWNGEEWELILDTSDTDKFSREIEEAKGEIEKAQESADKAVHEIDVAVASAGFTSLGDTLIGIKSISQTAQTNAANALTNAQSAQSLASELSGKVSGYEQTVNGFTQTVNNYEDQVAQFSSDVTGLNSTIASYETEVDEYGRAVNTYATQVTTFETTVKGLQSTVSNPETGLMSQVTQLANGFNALASDFEDYQDGLLNILTHNVSDWELGGFNLSNGAEAPSNSRFRTKSFIPISDVDYVSLDSTGHGEFILLFYDKDKKFLDNTKGVWNNVRFGTYEVPSGTRYFRANARYVDDRSYSSIEDVGVGTWMKAMVVKGTEIVSIDKFKEPNPLVQSQLSVLSDNINLRVTKGDVLSQINIEAERTLIQSDRLLLNANNTVITGTAWMDGAVIKDLSADKITTGTLNASNVKIINLDFDTAVGNKADFVKSAWESVAGGNVKITGDGIVTTASDNSQTIIQNGVTMTRNPSGATIGQIGYVYDGGSPTYSIQTSWGSHLAIHQRFLDPYFSEPRRKEVMKMSTMEGGGTETKLRSKVYLYGDLDLNSNKILNQSDARLKTNIRNTKVDSLNAIVLFNFKDFNWKDPDLSQEEQLGIVAQQVQGVAPELIEEDQDGKLSIDSSRLSMMTSHAVQQLNGKVDDLDRIQNDKNMTVDKKIKELENEIEKLRNFID